MEGVESQIAGWRAYVANAPGVNGHDVDELEDHLRHQIAELTAAGLTPDEGFLIAVKRLGDVDVLSREFAREHSGRLWKQLLLSGDDEPARRRLVTDLDRLGIGGRDGHDRRGGPPPPSEDSRPPNSMEAIFHSPRSLTSSYFTTSR